MHSKSNSLFVLLILAFTLTTAGQKAEQYTITPYEVKVYDGLYNSITVIDNRMDTSNLGIVQRGAFNRQFKVVAASPLTQQFNDLIRSLNANEPKQGELLLLIREFSFAEITRAMSESGYFHFRAVLFAKDGEQYRKLSRIDTVVVVNAMDVTKKMFKLGNKTVTNFIAANLTQKPGEDMTLALDQIHSLDSIEKTRLPLYTAEALADGVYYSFASFVNQIPDAPIKSVRYVNGDKIRTIIYTNKKGKEDELDYRTAYAVVHNNKAQIAGEFSFYPLEKRGNDFYFTGKVLNAKPGDVATASFFFGIIGGLLASSATAIMVVKIDHLTGGFIRIREVGGGE